MMSPRAAQICRTRPMEAPGLPRSTSLMKRGLRPSMEASSSMLRPSCFRRARMSCPHSAGVVMWFVFIPDGELLLENAAKSSLFSRSGMKKRTRDIGFELIDFLKRWHFLWEGNELRPNKCSSFSLAACETVPAACSLHGAKHTGQFPHPSENSAFTHTRFLQSQG